MRTGIRTLATTTADAAGFAYTLVGGRYLQGSSVVLEVLACDGDPDHIIVVFEGGFSLYAPAAERDKWQAIHSSGSPATFRLDSKRLRSFFGSIKLHWGTLHLG